MEIIGRSPAIGKIKKLIAQVAATQANVLIMGESGTGKELVARMIHKNSLSAPQLFVAVNCAAIPTDLLESELFGHEKGAFTGAISTRKGRFELANKGTIFLDEIGEMPFMMQSKLLRVLQEKSFEKVGSNTAISTNMRVISATNCVLAELVAAQKFREDLFYRLNVFPIIIPPLRDRREDIPPLLDYFLDNFNKSMSVNCRLSTQVQERLIAYCWPGNVREVSNMIERLCILYPAEEVTEVKLDEGLSNLDRTDYLDESQEKFASLVKPIIKNKHAIAEGFDLKKHLSDTEKALINAALQQANGVIAHAAEALGLRRTTLAEKMRKYGVGKD